MCRLRIRSSEGGCRHDREILQKKNAKAFPAPPKAPYWVRLDLNETEFVKTASR